MNTLLRKVKGHIAEPKLGTCSTITGASPCNMSLKGVPVAKCFFRDSKDSKDVAFSPSDYNCFREWNGGSLESV